MTLLDARVCRGAEPAAFAGATGGAGPAASASRVRAGAAGACRGRWGCRGHRARGGACRIRRPVPPGSPGGGASRVRQPRLPGPAAPAGACRACRGPGSPGLLRQPRPRRGCRGTGPPRWGCWGRRRARPPKKICKKLDKPLQGGYFPPQVTHRFSNKGGNAGRKKGLKTRSPVAQSRNLAYIRYGSLGADKPGAQRLTLDKHEKTCKFFRIKA